jgi:hypothetical protein
MEAFLLWAFGARQIEMLADLTLAARERAAFLCEVPDAAEVRQELIRLTREVVSQAERKMLHAEADLASSLLARARSDDRTVRGLDGMVRAYGMLEEMITRRLEQTGVIARWDVSQTLEA